MVSSVGDCGPICFIGGGDERDIRDGRDERGRKGRNERGFALKFASL